MNLEDRLEQLEETVTDLDEEMAETRAAHRALAAEHTALRNMLLALFPLIPASVESVRSATTTAFDAANAEMDARGIDPEFQRDVRAGIESLTAALLSIAAAGGPGKCDPSAGPA